VYEVPLVFHREGLDSIIVKGLGLEDRPIDLSRWEDVVRRVKSPRSTTRLAVVGKYVELRDSYKSLVEALVHGGIAHQAKVDILWVDAEHIERDGPAAHFADVDGVLVPGGFGDRGIEGKIQAVRYAREQRVPYFGRISDSARQHVGDPVNNRRGDVDAFQSRCHGFGRRRGPL